MGKALESFNYIKKYFEDYFNDGKGLNKESVLFNEVEDALINSEKEHEALELIAAKWVIPVYIHNAKDVEQYNKDLRIICFKSDYEARKLNQEEFKKLKELL